MVLTLQVRHAVVRLHRQGQRLLSTTNDTYPSKVRGQWYRGARPVWELTPAAALPFKFSADYAVRRWAPLIAARVGISVLISSVLARWLPWLGYEPFKPVRIQAAYLPIWMIDGEVAADGWFSDNDGEPKKTLSRAFFLQSYMPAFAFEPLYSVSLRHPVLKQFNNVRWSEDLKTQHGHDILCLPFSMTPFRLMDAVRKLSTQDARVSDELRFDPASVKEEMIAAYPLLLPVYLAEYELNYLNTLGQTLTMTVVFEAHTKKGRIIMENIDRKAVDLISEEVRKKGSEMPNILKTLTSFINEEDVLVSGLYAADSTSFAVVDRVVVYCSPSTPTTGKGQAVFLSHWVDNVASETRNFTQYRKQFFSGIWKRGESEARTAIVDWDDLRIREHTQEETAQNKRWLRQRMRTRTIEAKGQILLQDFAGEDYAGEPTVENARREIAEMSRDHDSMRPGWLTEWMQRNRHESKGLEGESAPAAEKMKEKED